MSAAEVTGELAQVRDRLIAAIYAAGEKRNVSTHLADVVLDALGLEQVGWVAHEPGANSGYSLYVATHEDDDAPVYRLRGTEHFGRSGVSDV